MPPKSSEPRLPPEWIQALETVQQSLTQIMTAAEERERRLDAPAAGVQSDEAWQAFLADLDDRLGRFHAYLREAETAASAADAALRAGEGAFKEWTASAQAIRRRLAKEGALPV